MRSVGDLGIPAAWADVGPAWMTAALALWLATAASNTWQRPEVSLTLAQRYAAAFVDLDTEAAVAELHRR